MKTKITTLTIALGLFLSVTAFAKAPVPASKAVAHSIAELISNDIEYPEFAIEEKFQGIVVVSVVIEDDGTFDVESANCVNEDMKEYVIEEIESIVSEKYKQYSGQTLLVKLTFDLKLY